MRLAQTVLLLAGLMPAQLGAAASDQPPAAVLALHPAGEPRPALKYQFVFPLYERRPGNAATVYNRIPASRSHLFPGPAGLQLKLAKWQETPLAELRSEEVRQTMKSLEPVIAELEAAARCETCDWQYPIREQPFWSILVPETTQNRTYARMLCAYVRWQIAEGRYDDAVRSFRSGYALARNAGHCPFIVTGLIGASIAGMLDKQLETFIQQPDAPNLFWAMQSLPRPLIDYRLAYRGEFDAFYLTFPELRDLDKKNYPAEYWRYLLQDLLVRFEPLLPELAPWARLGEARTLAAMLEGYPRAKQYLVDRGRPAAEVEAMPVPQVVLLYTTQLYEEIRDETFKGCLLPYPEARPGFERAQAKLVEAVDKHREIVPLVGTLLPQLSVARISEVRTDRDFVAIQVLEAIRLYAATHHGQLPDRLAEITDVSVPLDPFNGRPFGYRREGAEAELESKAEPWSLRYRIRMVPQVPAQH